MWTASDLRVGGRVPWLAVVAALLGRHVPLRGWVLPVGLMSRFSMLCGQPVLDRGIEFGQHPDPVSWGEA